MRGGTLSRRLLTGSYFDAAFERAKICRMKVLALCLLLILSSPPAEAKGDPVPTTELDQTRKLAERTIIPKVEYREASVPEIFTHITKVSKDLDPNKTGVVFELSPTAKAADSRVTISLRNVPLIELVKYVTNLANLRYNVTGKAIVISGLAEKVAEK